MRTNEEIVRILIDEKNKQKLSISELARRVDMAKSAVSRYFNFTREFPLNRADDFAKVLGISTEYLLGISKEDTNDADKLKTSPLVQETLKAMEQLEEPRQKVVLETAKSQLKEQETEKESTSNIITLKNRASELTDEEFEKALDEAVRQTVAFDGKPLDEREQAIAKQMLKDAWEEDNGKR